MLILSYENEISFTSKLNSFSYEWLCTGPRFEGEALVYEQPRKGSERTRLSLEGEVGVFFFKVISLLFDTRLVRDRCEW